MDIHVILQALYNNPQAKILVVLVLANLIVGTYGAWRRREFQAERIGDFILRKLVPLMVAYASATLLAWGIPDFWWLSDAAWIALVAAGAGNVVRNVAELGVPVKEAQPE